MRVTHGLLVLVLVAAAAAGGWWLGTRSGGEGPSRPAGTSSGPCPGGAQPLHWRAPMDPTYVRDAPGKSPMGMDLVPVCPGEQTIGGGGVRIEPALVQSIGVHTAPVERRDLAREVRAVGRVAYDERRVSHVHTKVQGWVERLFVEYEGEVVRRGQPLLEIYSPELVSTQQELLLAARYRESTRQSGFEDVAQGGEDLFQATLRRLEFWDISRAEIERLLETKEVRKTLTLHAPTEGFVTHLMVREGMEVGPNDNLYTIADLTGVWIYADVYEYELPWVGEGQRALVELSYLPGRTFEGVVTYVYPFLDPKTRTARVRVELENPDLVLKPDMFADVTIETSAREGVLVVPDEAVIRSGRRTLVIVALGEGRFSPREVELGIESGTGWVEIEEGLSAGELVVTSGQFLIDSESRLREAVQKLVGEAADTPGAEMEAHPGMDAGAAPEPPETTPRMDHGAGHEAGPPPPAGPPREAGPPTPAAPPRDAHSAHPGA